MGTDRDFALGDGDTMQCADEVWLSCTLETFMGLLTNVTPMNSIKQNKQTTQNTLSSTNYMVMFSESSFVSLWFPLQGSCHLIKATDK